MSNKQEARYFVVRYMYNDLRDEAANIGIVMASSSGLVTTRFLDDVMVKARADVKIDQASIDDFRAWLERSTHTGDQLVPKSDGGLVWEEALMEHAGNVVRVSGPRTVLFDDFNAEADTLFREWVAPRLTPKERAEVGPRDPLGGLRREAKSAIVRTIREAITMPLTRKQFVQDYEIRGVIHRNKFDAALVPGKTGSPLRLFHHVLILPDAEESYDQAAALARRWLDVQHKSGNHKQLTAVFYSREDVPSPSVAEAAALLKHDKIEAASLDRLADIASDLAPQPRLFAAPRRPAAPRRRSKRPSR